MIEQEILRLVPDWAGGNCGDQQEYYTYADDDDNEEQPPFYYLSSSPTSSHGSHCGVGPTASGLHGGHGDWLQGIQTTFFFTYSKKKHCFDLLPLRCQRLDHTLLDLIH
jgi:hypothetical protein